LVADPSDPCNTSRNAAKKRHANSSAAIKQPREDNGVDGAEQLFLPLASRRRKVLPMQVHIELRAYSWRNAIAERT
jgi:hypothetical protein